MHPILRHLPDHLIERTRARGPDARADGACVLYWMRNAARGHDNPALDAALHLADALERPLFVYHGLSPRYPFASDRIHRFILEGARDVAAELSEQRIAYAFHLEHSGDRPVIEQLAEAAAAIVCEDCPTPPSRRATQSLARSSPAPLLAVDTACVFPMRLVKRRPERAFRFRQETQAARLERLALPWPPFAGRILSALPRQLPFEPVDLAGADLGALVAACDIDHMVGPVADTPGGSRAGYARWARFRDERLHAYARRRNDALDRDGVSRLSPYLHFGHVSPFAIAREAMAVGGPGAAKFLDELLVWRELAHAWCFHTEEIETLEALPRWAQATLEAHRDDTRDRTYDWETLARGRTGDALWDAAQTSLMVHGELHNNLRMTWGKALPPWTATPEAAMRLLVDLNHRFALDGRDPNSYGGLFWCLGLFDRPFEPPSPVTGTLRARSTVGHAKRLDVDAYRARVTRANLRRPPKVAVIGAGMAGLVCARTLRDHGLAVTVFDKSRGVGGRIATRRVGDVAFDHGAQYFTTRDLRFQRYVQAWTEQGLVAAWTPADGAVPGDAAPWQVPVPGMSALGRHLAADLEVVNETTIRRLLPDSRGWRLVGDGLEDRGPFRCVVVAVPAPQAAALLEPLPALAGRAGEAGMAPCWAGLFAFKAPLDLPDVVRPGQGPLAWITRDAAKPQRPSGETWVVHASHPWSRANLERDVDEVLEDLRSALGTLAGPLPETTYAAAHRWRYALADAPLGEPCLFDAETGVAACGDWCLGGRIEAAFLSGAAAAGRLLNLSVDLDRGTDHVAT